MVFCNEIPTLVAEPKHSTLLIPKNTTGCDPVSIHLLSSQHIFLMSTYMFIFHELSQQISIYINSLHNPSYMSKLLYSLVDFTMLTILTCVNHKALCYVTSHIINITKLTDNLCSLLCGKQRD